MKDIPHASVHAAEESARPGRDVVPVVRGLLFTDKFPPHPGGTAVIYHNWVAHLRGDLTAVTCMVPGRPHREIDRDLGAPVYRVPFINIPKIRFPLAWLAMLLVGPWAILRQRPQVLHVGQPLETGFIVWLLGRFFGLPYVVHCFGNEIPFFWRKPLAGPVMRLVARHAARITAISSFSADELARLGIPRERIAILHPGVEPAPAEGSPDDVRGQFGLGDGPVLLTLARLVPRKGQDTVIRAMPSILARLPEARYLIAGTGPDEARLQRLARECGVEHAVVFAGSVPHDKIAGYYAACDVVIHPNRRMPDGDVEGFGIIFLEANVFGKPVIGGNSGGTPDAIVDGVTGILVDPTDVDAVAEAAIRILTDRELARRLGEQGMERARTEFTWEMAVERLHAMNESVARSRGAQ